MIRQGLTPAPLSAEQGYLRRIDARLAHLSLNARDSTEYARMEAAREDVVSRMSSEDLSSYKKATDSTKSREQLAAEAETERLAMEANRDRPAI